MKKIPQTTFKPPIPTMMALAILSNVTRPVVSYYYGGKQYKMSPATRARIEANARAIGFEVDAHEGWIADSAVPKIFNHPHEN